MNEIATGSDVEFNEIDEDFEIFDSEFSELNTTIEYDEATGAINYTSQFDAIIITSVFILFAVSLLVGVLLGGMFFKR